MIKLIPICCVGCHHSLKNTCNRPKVYCFIYRVIHFFLPKYSVRRYNDAYPKIESRSKGLLVSETLIIGIDLSNGNDLSAVQVSQRVGNSYKVINSFYGEEAEWMAGRLIDTQHKDIPFKKEAKHLCRPYPGSQAIYNDFCKKKKEDLL